MKTNGHDHEAAVEAAAEEFRELDVDMRPCPHLDEALANLINTITVQLWIYPVLLFVAWSLGWIG